ncbi:hypothetical protein TNCV_3975831 [Trichonephila clavipes]|nr:hypothetical protein TNCV_3975831 [Trichonephila clavipes]
MLPSSFIYVYLCENFLFKLKFFALERGARFSIFVRGGKIARAGPAHNQELTRNELTEIHEQEQDIEELESLDPVQSEDRMTVDNNATVADDDSEEDGHALTYL